MISLGYTENILNGGFLHKFTISDGSRLGFLFTRACVRQNERMLQE